ncbi:MAG TPA: elongation factor P-like protein YeiP [Kiritimatiellia bacterium]|jgi:elongation factor P|nr:MAG: Elongation factor P-like protein [Verrucomicrobia bacterium ADurb.Bin070]HPB10379.1 elongation factor P-like protein YeiP [Kiritimatiellia bacterium]HQA37629.1 elongation factor P-like protein YeiP [Kiritimatiellia bacterium]HQQ91579.1 elongation factor P-like protein YeiP [Kiritimatiellia bacterium]
MLKACDLKKGSLVGLRGLPHVLESLSVTTPSARGAASIYHFRFRNLVTKAKQDVSCKGEEPFDDIDFERRPVQYLYREADLHTFMDTEDFSQFTLPATAIEEQLDYLVEDMEGLFALTSDGKILTIEVPQKVVLTIASCDPVMKGASVTARSKPAKCQTGLVVQVPEYLETGEAIIVDTATGTYLSRAAAAKF